MHKEFETYKLNETGITKAKEVADKFDSLLLFLELAVWPNDKSREMAIAKTKLEEACFFIKKALSSVESYQVK